MVLEKTLENPLDCKEFQPIHPKGNQSWIFIGRTDAEAKTPILWPPDVKSQLTRKVPDAGNDWKQEETGMTEDEMIAWHHWLHGHEFEQALGVGDGLGSLACCSAWGHKELDTTEGLNSTEVMRERTCWCHAQSHVSELRLSLSSQQEAGSLPQYSSVDLYRHGNHYYIDPEILQRILTRNDEWSYPCSILFHCMAGKLYFSLVSSF